MKYSIMKAEEEVEKAECILQGEAADECICKG